MARRDRLETLLRIRRLEEDMAKAKLALAAAEHRAAVTGLHDAEAAYRRITEETVGAFDHATFARVQARANAAAGSVIGREQAVEIADQARTQQVEDTKRASMKAQGIERLVDRAKEAQLAEILAADQRTAEESRAGRRKKGNP